MRVVQVTPRYPPRTGGVETHVQELSERIVQRGHEVTVLTADAGDDVPSSETLAGVDVVRHRGVAPNGAFHVAPGILQTTRRLEADVVHAHNYHALPLLFAAVGASDTRFVVTPHYHGASASPYRDRLLSLYRPFGGWALRQADAVIAVSEWEREQLGRDYGVDATVIPNGVDIGRFRDAEPEERDRPYLLTVGRLEEYKGVQHVIRALPNLPSYDLVVVGEGSYLDDLHRIVREANVENRVDFLGRVSGEKLAKLYAGAEVHVSLSEFESYGLTIGEALAAGTPCLIRNEGGLTNWAVRAGVVPISEMSSDNIVTGIQTARAQSIDETLSSWDDMACDVSSVYTDLTDSPPESNR